MVFDDAKSTLQEFGALRCKCRAFSADLGKTSLKIVCSSDSCTTLHSLAGLAQNGVAGWPFMEFSRPGNILNLFKSTSGIQWQLTTCLKLISIIIILNLSKSHL